MPIHFSDLDVISEVDGVRSALIVPCTMCPAATLAVREKQPFLKLFRIPEATPAPPGLPGILAAVLQPAGADKRQ